MLPVRLIMAISATGVALAGCSSSSPPAPQVVQFESDPPGANVQTAQGQTCRTPCSLSVPATIQPVTFSLNGYVDQTIQVSLHPPEHSLFSTKQPDLSPNQVRVALQAVPPPPPKGKSRPGKVTADSKASGPPVTPPPLRRAPEPEPEESAPPPRPWSNPTQSSSFPSR